MNDVELDAGSGQLRNVRLYGRLGVKFGRVHRLAVGSAAEAVRALGALYPEFDAYMTQSKDRGEGYAVFYGNRNLAKEQLCDPNGRSDIRIAPVLLGSKNGGWLNVIVGAVLIIVGAVLSVTPFAALSPFLYSAGIAMIAGGVVQLLTPVPKGSSSKDRPDNQASYNFNGPINTQAQGNPVQLLYGKLHIGSAVLSAGINAVDQAIIPNNRTGPGRGPSGGGGFPGFTTSEQ
jgi:predicted phage tail protein